MLALRARSLFDGACPEPVDRPLVTVEGGRIVSVEARGAAPPGATVVDLGDSTLLPGFVDTHVHLAFDASDDVVGRVRRAGDAELLERMRAAGRAALAAGVTTVRDLGDRGYLSLRLRAETAADPTAGPKVLAAGPPVTTPGGHCWFLGGQAEGVEGVRAAVRERAERGVDVVKVMVTGGDLTPGSDPYRPQYGPAELRAAVREAHRHELPITAHAHAASGIAVAVAAGFDSIEHCFFLTDDGVHFDRRVLDEMVRAGVVASLTLGALPGGPPPPPRIAQRAPGMVAGLAAMRQAGVTTVCGSDSGVFPVKPHGCYPYSVAAMVERGYTPVEALRAATSTAARLCGIAAHKGCLAPGYDADVVAVAGDPLTDITAVHAVTAVFRGGARVV
ncbi:amidohydrolase [Streptomyces eurocidicus]|uniref:Amidohydrolase n=1 Tax=Streptomyces eurocidicus TaxID=66423 RepID=A0A2N8NNA5_STREU|nr:amidohydrolase family protein [Streptomyces eurocidicus]MBB5118079.1 imidazolonepropionase-like amidohydrolase [Streptomyces eurocidicus]MBF6054911.1 amidohydrolase family protein [Streptomyces eurocidicus]PNE30252.1 amidohydrolase [Streptomyces eurocidicus]